MVISIVVPSGELCTVAVNVKMGIYYEEQSGKGFKVKCRVSEEEIQEYLSTWTRDEELIRVCIRKCYGSEDEYAIWCLKYDLEKSNKIVRFYTHEEEDQFILSSYRDDILDIAFESRQEGKLISIDFDETLISERNNHSTKGTFYPMTLKSDINPWNNMHVVVETIPELCGDEEQSEEMEEYIEEIKNGLKSKDYIYDIKETISITEANFE